MSDALLFLDGILKLALVVGVMVLVATAPSLSHPAGHGQQAVAAQATEHDQDDKRSWGHRMLLADDDRWPEPDDTSPSMNLDGTPMCGDIDLDGNFYGDSGSAFDSWDGSTSSMWD